MSAQPIKFRSATAHGDGRHLVTHHSVSSSDCCCKSNPSEFLGGTPTASRFACPFHQALAWSASTTRTNKDPPWSIDLLARRKMKSCPSVSSFRLRRVGMPPVKPTIWTQPSGQLQGWRFRLKARFWHPMRYLSRAVAPHWRSQVCPVSAQ